MRETTGKVSPPGTPTPFIRVTSSFDPARSPHLFDVGLGPRRTEVTGPVPVCHLSLVTGSGDLNLSPVVKLSK